MDGKRFMYEFNKFIEDIKIGDKFWLSQSDIAIEHDFDLPELFEFTVVAKYPYVVDLEKPCKCGIHRQSISYINLFLKKLNNEDMLCM